MRAEEKELEGPELEREQRLEVMETREGIEEELPVHAGIEVTDIELAHRGRLFDALSVIMSGGRIDVGQMGLPQRETQALEFLQSAVTGRDVHMGTFVYAEDRSSMLEQALAVLQQNLTHGSAAELGALHAKFDQLTAELGDLREALGNLEEAQDDLERPPGERVKVTGDTDDKPAQPEQDESLTGFLASALQALAHAAGTDTAVASSLVGPELAEATKPPSTLAGDEVAAPERPGSTLSDGPEVEDTRAPSTLADGPPRREPVKLPSMLDGPERAAVAKRSTLYSEGLSKALLRPASATSPPPLEEEHEPASLQPPTRKSTPTIEPPARKSSPSIAPDTKPKKPDGDKPRGKKRGG